MLCFLTRIQPKARCLDNVVFCFPPSAGEHRSQLSIGSKPGAKRSVATPECTYCLRIASLKTSHATWYKDVLAVGIVVSNKSDCPWPSRMNVIAQALVGWRFLCALKGHRHAVPMSFP